MMEYLGDQLSPHRIWIWSTEAVDQLWLQAENKRIVSQAAAQFFPTECSVGVPLSRSGILTSTHSLVRTPGRPSFSLQYLSMENCGTGSALTFSVCNIV